MRPAASSRKSSSRRLVTESARRAGAPRTRTEPGSRSTQRLTSPWTLSDLNGAGFSGGLFGPALHRCEQHRHVAAVLLGRLLDRAEFGNVLGEPHQEALAALRMGLLAAPEHDRDLHAVVALQEADHVVLLGLVVVGRDLRAQLDLADVHLLLVAPRGLGLLLLLVLVFRVVEHSAHGRPGVGSYLDEVEVALLRVAERLLGIDDTDLVAVLPDEANLRHPDALVDTGLVPLRHPPIELTRDRH